MIERARRSRGILDTSTVILLPRMNDAQLLPEEVLITEVIEILWVQARQ